MAKANAISRMINQHIADLRGKVHVRQTDADVVLTFSDYRVARVGEKWARHIRLTVGPKYAVSSWNGNSIIISDAT